MLADAQAAYQAELAKKAEELHVPIFAVMFSEVFAQPDVPVITEKEDTDTAIYVLSRNSGEGADRYNRACDYLLGENELADIAYLAEHYEKTVLILNIANLVDTTELKKIKGLNAILLAGQAGNATGNIVADVVLGKSIPSGKLTDTWAASYEDYPSSKNFSHNNGDTNDEYYSDGIYVGYRYFDTFNVTPNYCFGYGKGYTDFETEVRDVEADAKNVTVTASVKNIGDTFAGKEVVQVYYSAPDGTIEKPYQELGGFGKSDLLSPGESQTITISFPTRSMASYDEKKAAWVLEAGTYYIRVGNSSRTTKVAAALNLKETVVTVQGKNLFPADDAPQELSKAGVTPYSYEGEAEEKAAAKQIDICSKCIKTETVVYSETPEAFPAYEGEKLTAADVKSGKATLKDLVSQLTVEEMATVCNGTADGLGQEGFIGSSSDMAPGAAGDTTSILLEDRGIYNTILADGPAGLRLIPHFVVDADGKMVSSGNPLEDAFNKNEIEVPEGGTEYFQYCTAIPVAALLAQSWNMDLIRKCGDIVGKEMEEFHISVWLAPGMNIHRNPLCGRNFEYYSEDPLVAGMCAAADTRGIQSHAGIGTSIKHFAANNQEDNRMYVNEHISERAMREIYLKGYEIAVKEGGARSIMSTYGPVNGIWTAGNYDLLTTILRGEWNYDGFVMTDWWAMSNREGYEATRTTHAPMVSAGNDVFMVCNDCTDMSQDDVKEALEKGEITRGDLQRNAMNVLHFILGTPCILRFLDRISEEEKEAQEQQGDNDFVAADLVTYEADPETGDVVIDASAWENKKGTSEVCGVSILADKMGTYDIEMEMKADLEDLAQLSVTVYIDNIVKTVISIRGTKGEWIKETRDLGFFFGSNHYLKLYFGANGMQLGKIRLKLREGMEALSKHEE